MKGLRILSWFFLASLIGSSVFAQDDETRQGTGLPMMIGENASNRNRGNLSGKITIEGLDPSQPKPIITVSVNLNGAPLDRRQVADNGSYFIPSVPRENITLIVEANGVEVGRQLLPPTAMGNIRQDLIINLAQGQSSKAKFGVISVKDAYSRSPENEKLFEKALSASKDKKLDDAISTLKQIVAQDPNDFVAWTELGTLLFRKEKYADASQAYLKALEQNVEFMVALLNFGRLLLNQKQPENALLILAKAVDVEPASPEANHLLGEAYLQAKKGSMAVVYLNEALRLAPIEKAEIHLRLAMLYNAGGLKDKAVQEYKQFLQKVPNYSEKEKLEKYIKDNSSQ
ncbi:MAG TPA: tetratricopeptide repeat protein [Pyrinomonadaceae bacterium]|nr:tetratricopeptide repeat protein [Pyrinomonadaceae bacterium]